MCIENKQVDIALKKYELIVKNIEFLDGWVMKVTAIFGVFIFAVITKMDKVILFQYLTKTWIIAVLIVIGILFSAILLRISKLIVGSKNQLKKIDKHFEEIGNVSVIDPSWGRGVTTTTYCLLFIGLTTIFTSLAIYLIDTP